MKLLRELLAIREEAIEVQQAADVWADNKDDAETYVSSTDYSVRKVEGGAKYEVTIEAGSQRKPFATLSRVELDASFTPIRANQTPDVEGYTSYRSADELDAFKYNGDTVKVDLGTGQVLMNKGDYLIRKTKGNDFTYEVKKAKDFDTVYTTK
jgi:hypothetical protein